MSGLRAVPDPGEESGPEFVYVIAIRSQAHATAADMEKALNLLGAVEGTAAVAMIKRPYSELTANDHGHLRELGFTFEDANEIATVVWTTE